MPFRDFAAEKARALATLAEFRRLWGALFRQGVNPDLLIRFKGGISIAVQHWEMETPERGNSDGRSAIFDVSW
jgi:hypothetical protein